MTKLISIVASKGGVGKTTVSAVLGDALAKKYKVAVLDCDCNQYSIEAIGEAGLVNFDYSTIENSKDFKSIISELKHEYDYIIFDTAPHSHTEELFLDILEASDTVIGVTQPSPNDVLAFHKIMLNLLSESLKYKPEQKQFLLINKVENIASDIQNQSFGLISEHLKNELIVLDTQWHSRAAFKSHGYFKEDEKKDKKKIKEVKNLIKELKEKGGL